MTDNEKLIEEACEAMHDAYEAAAVREGWETQERSRKPWAEVPDANKRTMRAAVAAALAVFDKAHTQTNDERDGFTPSVEQVWDSFSLGAVESSDLELDMVELRAMFDRFIAALRCSVVPKPSDSSESLSDLNSEGDGASPVEAPESSARCPKCGATVTDQTPSTFYTHHDETCGGELNEPQGEPSDAQTERARIIADLREWSRPLGNSPEEETLRLVIERIERAAGVGGAR